MKRRAFLAAIAGGFLSAGFAGAESDPDVGLEQEVASSANKAIYFDPFLGSDHYPNGMIRSGIGKIEDTVYVIKSYGLDLTRTYEEGSVEDTLQGRLRNYTLCLFKDVKSSMICDGLPYENALSDSLCVLLEVEETFGNHPFHHVIIGRQRRLVYLAAELDVPVPDEFYKYIDPNIPPWQDPTLDYRTLDDLRNAKDKELLECIPPEFRE